MEIEEKGLFRSYFRFSVYAKRCKGKQEDRNERYKYFDCTEEGKNAMNT